MSKRATYRHGNVREAATEAGFRILDETGLEALTMRNVADSIGVAHRSLYLAFNDREGLLDAIAVQAFDAMHAAVKSARSGPDFAARYCRFALGRSGLYDVMMSRRHGQMKHNPELQASVHRVITKAFEFFATPGASSPVNRRAVMRITMLLHGAITLYRMGVLDIESDRIFLDEVRRMVG